MAERKLEATLYDAEPDVPYDDGAKTIFLYTRACLKNHSRNLHVPLCGIFCPNSVAVARYGALIRTKSPTNCDAHLAESLFQTRSRGTKGQVSEEVRQFLRYMEKSTSENAVNDTLRDFHHMVETVKKDREVSVKYMKQFERDNMMRAEGREEERKNTEREHARAERECARADKERTRANALEAELKRLKSKML